MPAHINNRARLRAFLGIPLSDCQSEMIGPKYLWLSNHVWKRSEDLEKHQADNSTSGVVGSSGKKIPIMPVMRDTHPRIINASRLPVITRLYSSNDVIAATLQ